MFKQILQVISHFQAASILAARLFGFTEKTLTI